MPDHRYRALLDVLDEAIIVRSRDGRVAFANPVAERLFSITQADRDGTKQFELADHLRFEDGSPADGGRDPVSVVLHTGVSQTGIVMRTPRDAGPVVWLSVNAHLLDDDDDDMSAGGVVVSLLNITRARRAEAALRDREARFRLLFENGGVPMVMLDPADQTFLEVNAAAVALYGYSHDELMAMNIADLSAEPDETVHAVETLRLVGSVSVPMRWHRKKDGTVFPVDISATSFEVDGGVVGAAIIHDISDRLAAQAALRESEARYRRIVETADEGIWIIDADSNTTFVNAHMAAMLGVEPEAMLGSSMFDFIDDEGRVIAEANLERRRAGLSEHHDFKFIRADGEPVWALLSTTAMMDDDGVYQGALALVTDVTERRRDEAALRAAEIDAHRAEADVERHRLVAELAQAQRLESLGRLAGGVAHDFNNLLGVILNYAEFVGRRVASDDVIASDIAMIQRAAQQAADVTHKLLVFGRADAVTPEVVDVSAALVAAKQLVDRPFGDRITVSVRPSSSPCLVRADRGQVEQSLLNLLLNARDAMPDGGTIDASTDCVNERVIVTVSDPGVGMEQSVLDRAFDPFFSTKSADAGSGLGLATVHGAVMRAGGEITIASQPGAGTTVTLAFPSCASVDAAGDAMPAPRAGNGVDVLVAEDNPEVRVLTCRILRAAGYEVVDVGSADEAVRAFEARQTISVLVTDIVMPRMSGIELADLLRTQRTGLGVVYMTGYARDGLPPNFDAPILAKPFSEDQLLDAVRRELSLAP